PGYGILQIRLPFVGPALSGKLPAGVSTYAVRGALLPIDGGVQAALTVPSSPYLAWLGRYQAFYLAGLAMLVLFGFVWGLVARPPAPKVVQQISTAPEPPPFHEDDGVVSPPRRAPRTPSPVSDPPAPVPFQPALPGVPGGCAGVAGPGEARGDSPEARGRGERSPTGVGRLERGGGDGRAGRDRGGWVSALRP